MTQSIISPGGYDLIIAFYDVIVRSRFKNHFRKQSSGCTVETTNRYLQEYGEWCLMLLERIYRRGWDALSRDSIP